MALLILLKGHPATGKSLIARSLAKHLRIPLIDKDDIKDHTVSNADGNELAYAIMWQIVGRQLSVGLSVVVDSPLSYPEAYARARHLAQQHHANLWVIQTQLNDKVWRQRLEARADQDSSHKIGSWQDMQDLLAHYDKCWRYPIDPDHHILVDTTMPADDITTSIVAKIKDSL